MRLPEGMRRLVRARGAGAGESGFTLIEMSVAMLVVMVVALAGLGALVGSLQAVSADTAVSRSSQLANEVLEGLETVPWNSLGFYAVDPRDTGSPPGYVSAFEGYPTVTLPAASVLDQRVPLPVRRLTRGGTSFTVRTHIVHLPETTDTRAFRRISVLVSWTSAEGRSRSARVDRNRTATTSEKGFEAFLLRSFDAAVRESSGVEKPDPFLLTWARTAAPSGSQVLVRATTNLSAAAVSLSYPAVDPATNATVQRTVAMSMANSDDRTWQYAVPATEQFRGETVMMTATATSAWDSTSTSKLHTFVDLLDPGHPTRRKVSVGRNFACRVDAGGAAWCWGADSRGQLGNGVAGSSTKPVRVGATTPGFVDVVTISAGQEHACATTKAGEVFCWGNASDGRVGATGAGDCSGTPCARSPLKVGLANVRMVSAGQAHSCAVTDDRRLYCWGEDNDGRLGTGATTDQFSPASVAVPDAVSVASSTSHTCAVDMQTRVWCWGDGSASRLNNLSSRTTPALTSVTGASTISSPRSTSDSEAHTCIVTTTGAVGCWGTNSYGQAGGASASSVTLRYVTGIANAVQIATGNRHSCATTHDPATGARSERCWGSNERGSFGNGTTSSGGPSTVSSPAGMAPPTGNGAGGLTSCATSVDDAVWCRGLNSSGELGNGTTTDSLVPVRVSGT